MKEYEFGDELVLRTPLHPIVLDTTENELKKFFSEPQNKEALFLASPDLHYVLCKWLNNDITEETDKAKLIVSLSKYYTRMHSRCTPFGLFAGCSLVKWGDQNEITLSMPDSISRHTRLDMNFLCALAQNLEKIPEIRGQLKFFPNTSLYAFNDEIRYVEYLYRHTGIRTHKLSSILSDEYIEMVLSKSKSGATIDLLSDSLVDDDISKEDAIHFISEIINSQLLVSELEPAITGKEFIFQIISVLEGIGHKSHLINAIISDLKALEQKILRLDERVVNNTQEYFEISESLKKFNTKYDLSKLFQTDLNRKLFKDATISKTITKDLKNCLEFINRITPKRKGDNNKLEEFAIQFYRRYGDAEISLGKALDVESGISYPVNTGNTDISPLIQGLVTNGNTKDNPKNILWDSFQSKLFNLITEANINDDDWVDLFEKWEPKDIEESSEKNPLPDSIACMFSILGKLDNGGHLIHLLPSGGSSAVNILSRFAHGNFEINDLIKRICSFEEELNKDLLIAEIVHLPEARTGNILLHPAFRKYEIPYLAKTSVDKQETLRVDDIMISVIPGENRILLRSLKHNKFILPRLSNAHNYSFLSLPIYHFLADMQTHKTNSGIHFSWGRMANKFKIVPRAVWKNVILKPKTWHLQKEDFIVLINKNASLEELSKWKRQWKLPNLFFLKDADNELLINWKSRLSLNMFLSIIIKRQSITITEFLFDMESAVVLDEEGNAYTNQLVAYLKTKKTKKTFPFKAIPQKKPVIPSSFVLGSEWLYYKIYCGTKTSDFVLTNIVKRLLDDLKDKSLIDNWFFIRYVDEEGFHLRLRFHFVDLTKISEVVDLFKNMVTPFIEKGVVTNVTTDTYKREIERYGENVMVLTEAWFGVDSMAILDVLCLLEDDQGEDLRWLCGILMIDELLQSFNYDSEKKLRLTEHLKNAFYREFAVDRGVKKQIDKKYRTVKPFIDKVMKREGIVSETILEVLKVKKEKSKEIVDALLYKEQEGQLKISLDSLLPSYVHMLLNRLFRSNQRLHELVIYDYMFRFYKSDIAKRKYLSK
ncbi:lantibiotic dehydratase [Maribacter sp. 2-571]|uniref:lantibiotic dehydratase n=1 Tax=Maribacter sp. 2-571 TaxID=3417569 RepID=UPI003D32B3D4